MNAVVGQEKLVKILDGYTLQSAPRTILFLGPAGCGKSWLATRFAQQLGLDHVDISSDFTSEKLMDYYQCPVPKLYIIDLNVIDEKQQNKILKFIEEPSANMYVILTARSEIGVLPTILNRCVKYTFEDYTPEQLSQFDWAINCSDQRIYQICKTPGQLNNLPDDNLDGLFAFCEKIVDLVRTSNYANTISLCTKINTKDDVKKFDFDLFFEVLLAVAFDNYLKTGDDLSFRIYSYTAEQRAKAFNKTLNKDSFLLNYFDNLWRLTR